MAHWLMKTEPDDYDWDRLVADGGTEWSGVRNFQAAANMRAMKAGDAAFFYRSVVDPAILGIMRIAKECYPDPADATGKFVLVRVRAERKLALPVTLKAVKADPRLADMKLVRQGRLSVSPVSDEHWRIICQMGGIDP